MGHEILIEEVMQRLSNRASIDPETVESVLDTLSEMGLLPPSELEPEQTTSSSDPAWVMTLQKYLSLSDKERKELVLDVQERQRDWINQQLHAHRAEWILVCKGKVIDFSARLNDYPSPERLMEVGKKYERVPFVFNRPPLFEETGWSTLEDHDFYPTLSVSVGAFQWDHATLLTRGKQLTADFDTGSPYLFFSWEWLLSESLVGSTSVDISQTWHHLGRQYVYSTRFLRIGITSEDGTAKSLPIACQ
jgi:hypothetical protein